MDYKSTEVWKEFGATIPIETKDFLQFYPNPIQSEMTFLEKINNLEIYDFSGKKVKSFQNPANSFDVSELEKGIYILSSTTASGKSSSQKMVKQ